MRVMEKCLSSLRKQGPIRRGLLVPTFRSSYTISAISFYELPEAMGTSKFMILVPLFDLKSLGSFRRLRCRDFKSAALALGQQQITALADHIFRCFREPLQQPWQCDLEPDMIILDIDVARRRLPHRAHAKDHAIIVPPLLVDFQNRKAC